MGSGRVPRTSGRSVSGGGGDPVFPASCSPRVLVTSARPGRSPCGLQLERLLQDVFPSGAPPVFAVWPQPGSRPWSRPSSARQRPGSRGRRSSWGGRGERTRSRGPCARGPPRSPTQPSAPWAVGVAGSASDRCGSPGVGAPTALCSVRGEFLLCSYNNDPSHRPVWPVLIVS